MTLIEKIKTIYPELVDVDFHPQFGTISVVAFGNDEPFIDKWNHPTLPRPTKEQLDAIKE